MARAVTSRRRHPAFKELDIERRTPARGVALAGCRAAATALALEAVEACDAALRERA